MLTSVLYLLFAGLLCTLCVVALVVAVSGQRLNARVLLPLAGAWLLALAVMTLRPGSGLGVRLNLVPIVVDGPASAVDAVLNVAVFVPFGLLLGAAVVRFRTTLLLALAITVAIEVTQYVSDVGRTADVNDVITNVVGACLGWGIARAIVAARASAPAPARAAPRP